MPNARANRGDTNPTPEPDAPVRIARRVTVRRSAAFYPIAGPSVTERDDQRLLLELEQMFEERLDDARDVAISIAQGCVLLQGIVSCPLASLLAEDLVFSLPEVSECHNELVVRTMNNQAILAA
jgi:osmotically-inducible protein OsmY